MPDPAVDPPPSWRVVGLIWLGVIVAVVIAAVVFVRPALDGLP